MLRLFFWSCVISSLFGFSALSTAQESDVTDSKLKTLRDHFPFVVPDSVDDWRERSDSLRRRVLVATGLWPLPEKTPMKPVLHSKIERDGFTVEKVYFQSLPGHFVTGMLFRPSEENQLGVVDGVRPGVLSPHGHGGRTMRLNDEALAAQIESGGEVFERSGRYPKLARCAQLARMGCVTFIFDMLGYADSQQIDYQTAHRHAEPRVEESNRDQPCFFSIDADLNLQSIMGLQTWNAIRALDFLAQLPDVDEGRLGVTGGSGGGTQTILIGAIDPRIKVGFPNGMVSTAMQGGCYCENCNYLRIGTGNVELAALFAPRPQGMTAANDWTQDMLTDGFPELKKLYSMLGVPENVICGDVLKYPHNYNYVTRAMMYPWMAKHLNLPPETPLGERDFEPLTEQQMQVWGDDHPAPKDTGIEHERRVLEWWSQQNDSQITGLIPNSDDAPDQLADYRRTVGGGWNVIFDRQLPAASELQVSRTENRLVVSHPDWNSVARAVVQKSTTGSSKRTLVVVRDQTQSAEQVAEFVATMLESRGDIAVNDRIVTMQFDDLDDQQSLVDDKRTYSAFTFGYNRPLVVKRFEQILCTLSALESDVEGELILLAAGNVSGPAAAGAAMVAKDVVDQFVFDSGKFRFENLSSYKDNAFLPGAVKYLGLPGLLSLRAPGPLTIRGESEEAMEIVRRVYTAAGAGEVLTVK